MPKTLNKIKEDKVREDHCEDVEQKILDIINTSNLSMKEMVWVIGRFLIDTGASLEGKIDRPISKEQAFKDYTNDPTIGNALVSSGVDLHNWLDIKD